MRRRSGVVVESRPKKAPVKQINKGGEIVLPTRENQGVLCAEHNLIINYGMYGCL